MVKQTAVPNQFNMKNHSVEQKSRDKRGLEQKNCTVKKLQQIHDEKCTMCE